MRAQGKVQALDQLQRDKRAIAGPHGDPSYLH